MCDNNDFFKESIINSENENIDNKKTFDKENGISNEKIEQEDLSLEIEILDNLPRENSLIFSRDIDTKKPFIKESLAEKIKSKKSSFWRYTAAVLCGMFAGALIFGGALVYTSKYNNNGFFVQQHSGSNQNNAVTTADSDLNNTGRELSVTEISYKVSSSVVGIVTDFTINSWYGQAKGNGGGSGVIISEDGYIITNNHVIEGVSSIKVVLSSGEEIEAKVIGQDEKTDIAVIKIEKAGLPAAELGKSSELQVGELAVAIGNPLGIKFQGSVTAGIISALNRTMTVDGRTYTLIQTDAAINPGNSGGPLLNKYGQVIGINTVKITSTETEGMGFAIPIDVAAPIVQELISKGYVSGRPQIGIGPRDITTTMSQYYNLPVGVYVSSVSKGSGAEAAGIKVGDIIIKADDTVVATTNDLNNIKDTHKAGEVIKLTIVRNGNTTSINVKLGEEKPTIID